MGFDNDVEEIYLGHTHRPFQGVGLRKQIFFNAGSGIRHLEFSPCFFECSGDIDEAMERSIRGKRQLKIIPGSEFP